MSNTGTADSWAFTPSVSMVMQNGHAEAIASALEAELSFYGQILGFTPPGVPGVKLV